MAVDLGFNLWLLLVAASGFCLAASSPTFQNWPGLQSLRGIVLNNSRMHSLRALLDTHKPIPAPVAATPNKAATDPHSVCPRDELYIGTFKGNKAPCPPNKAGETCYKDCSLTGVTDWVGKQRYCESNGVFSHYAGSQAPDCWHWAHTHCLGSRQTPINIQSNDAVADSSLTDLQVLSNNGILKHTVKNTGHDLKAQLDGRSSTGTRVTGGPLGTQIYKIAQFHIHFASEGAGSEHQIDSTGFNAELHIVMINTKYSSFAVALQHCDGLAVIGVMLSDTKFKGARNAMDQTDLEAKTTWQNYIRDHLASVKTCGSQSRQTEMHILRLLPATYKKGYYTYHGSLTTPPCSESVTWMVMKDGFNVDPGTFSSLRDVMSAHGGPMGGNFRPLQKMNGRLLRSPGQ